MKSQITLLLLLFFVLKTKPQNAFFDALEISTVTEEQVKLLKSFDGYRLDSQKFLKENKNFFEQLDYKKFSVDQFSEEELRTVRAFNLLFSAKKLYELEIDRQLLDPALLKKILVKLTIPKNVQAARQQPLAFKGENLSIGSIVQGLGNSISRIGQADFQSILIDATAKYIAESFKEDVVYHYFSKFQDKLGEFQELKGLLPGTYEKIGKIDPFNFKDLGNSWKTAFESDIRQLPVNCRDFIKNGPPDTWYGKLKGTDFFKYYSYSVDIIQLLIMGYHPVEILQLLDKQYYEDDGRVTNEYESIIQLLNILQKNLQDTAKTEAKPGKEYLWVDFNQLKLLNTPQEIKYFFALIYLDEKEYFNNDDIIGKKIKNLFIEVSKEGDLQGAKTKRFFSQIGSFLILINQVQNSFAAIASAEKENKKVTESIIVYISETLNLIKETNSLLKKMGIDARATDEIDKYLSFGNIGLGLYRNVVSKNYPALIDNTIFLIDSLTRDKLYQDNIYGRLNAIITLSNEIIQRNSGWTRDLAEKMIKDCIDQSGQISWLSLETGIKELVKYSSIPKGNDKEKLNNEIDGIRDEIGAINSRITAGGNTHLRFLKVMMVVNKYGQLISQVARTETSDDLKAVIKTYLLPSGSYAIQRTSLQTLTISTHVGISAGAEADGKWSNFATNFGLTVPIGFEFTWARTNEKRTRYPYLKKNNRIEYMTGASQGLFLQIFDLAAVVNYRLKNEEESLPDKITLKQIFSPGLSYNFGLKNSPFDIGLGLQYTPGLRKIGDDLQANSYRFFIRFSWSKPLIPLAVNRERSILIR